VPAPKVDVQPCRLDGDWLVYDWFKGGLGEVPPELYLHEVVDIDPADAEQVAALSNKIGRLTPLHDLLSDLPYIGDKKAEHHVRTMVQVAAQHGRSYLPPGGDVDAEGIPMLRVHVDEAAYRLRVLRRLGAHAVAYGRGESVKDVWRDLGLGKGDCESEAEAWGLFTDFANTALQPFHVRVAVEAGHPDYKIGEPRPNAFQVAVLQIVNDLVDEVDYKTCMAEGCGRPFARQRDSRSIHGYNRTSGVVYCSRSCANTQTQRQYRRRKRAERNQP
jgi:hypothetical protein